MGYTTEFQGRFDLNKKLDEETLTFLTNFSTSRRMARKIPAVFGIEGEFYVGDDTKNVIDHNRPPKTQPSLWCQWIPNSEGTAIEWDGVEKFYSYIEWIEYIVKNFLEPKGYKLNGTVQWRGEDWNDTGTISIKDNKITIK